MVPSPPRGSRVRLGKPTVQPQVFASGGRKPLSRRDFQTRRLIEQTVDLGNLQLIRTITLTGIKKARGQDILLPPDHVNYNDYWDAFQYVDFVHRAVQAKNATMWQHGFDTVPKKKGQTKEKQRADELLTALEADVTLPEGTSYGIILGNMWWEPLRSVDDKVAELKPLDPTRVAAIVDDNDMRAGTVSEWVQLGPDGKEIARFAGDELIHLRFNRYRGSPFGIGDLQCILLTVKQLLYMEQKLPEIVRKRSDPTLWFLIANLVNGQLTPLTDEKFLEYTDAVKILEPTENLFTGPYVQKVEEIYKSAGIAARQGLESFLEHFKRKLQSGLAVPDIILGEGRMTTEATAMEQTELYHQDIRWKQRFVKRLIEQDIFTREQPPIQDIKIEFNPLTPDDVYLISRRLIDEVKAGIIGAQFARKELGYEEDEATVGLPPPVDFLKQQPQQGQGGGSSQSPMDKTSSPDKQPQQQSEEPEISIIKRGGRPYATIERLRKRKHG